MTTFLRLTKQHDGGTYYVNPHAIAWCVWVAGVDGRGYTRLVLMTTDEPEGNEVLKVRETPEEIDQLVRTAGGV